VALGPPVYGASKRNKYQKQEEITTPVRRARPVRKADKCTGICPRNVRSSTSHNPRGLHGLSRIETTNDLKYFSGSFLGYDILLSSFILETEAPVSLQNNSNRLPY
jgi:hypothetical protein